ncbi:hypothetical protein L9W92_16825 [Pelotomaculum terephthalicicum JT]|uniref:hypothetical protein n=1 Tax=Pelotomaculum terephthalicicum TaxID=206393 RepID=UPI001F036E10|nr:hypothetical protein [Pelotomaculum terephthalicicum]MCG9969668.1 hypothetical protein [Pelotomaculum terephthalicicum JT]
MGKKTIVGISVLALVLALMTATFIFFSVNNLKKGPSETDNTVPSGLITDVVPSDKVDAQSSRDAYVKATSLAIRTPEADDIKTLIPVMMKFSPAELSTLTSLASKTMTREEIEQAKSILLGKLNQKEVNLLLQLGPKYGLDFRAVLGATDEPKP